MENKTTYQIVVAGTGYVGLSNAILLAQLSPRKDHEKKARHKAYPHGFKKPCGARAC